MKRVHVLLIVALAVPAMAQHPFYLQSLQDGENAMSLKNWDMAFRYLEIAAFGLLDEPELLSSAYMRLAIVADAQKNKEQVLNFLSKVQRTGAGSGQPKGLSKAHWNAYQVLAGLKEPPPPPLPSERSGLESYVRKYPQIEAGWIALIEKLKGQSKKGDLRRVLNQAGLAHPRSKSIARLVLANDLDNNRGRNAEKYADELLALDSSSSLANEVLGNLAAKGRDYEKAKAYYQKVTKPELDETTALRRKMETALEKIEREARRAQLKKEQERKERAAGDNKTLAEARAADEARKRALEKEAEPKPRPIKPKVETSTKVVGDSSREKTVNPLKAAKKAVAANPRDLKAKYHLLDLYLAGSQLRDAKKLLKDIGGVDAESMTYLGAFAHYNYLRNSYKKIVKDLGTRRTLNDKARYYLGMSYFKLKDYKKAKGVLRNLDRKKWPVLETLDRTLKKEVPDNKGAASAGDRTDAIRAGKKDDQAVLRDGSLAERLEVFARLSRAEDWRTLRRPVKKAYAEAPRNQDVVYYRARLYLANGDFKRASNLFYNLSSTGYKEGEVLYWGGLAAHKNGDTPLAGFLFRRALMEGTTHKAEVEKLLAPKQEITLLTGKTLDGKIKELETLTRKYDFLEPQFALMRLYAVTGDKNGYEKLKNKLSSKQLTTVWRDLLMGWNLCKFGHYDKALSALANYNTDEATFLKGYLFHLMGETRQSEKILKQLARNDNFPEVPLLLK